MLPTDSASGVDDDAVAPARRRAGVAAGSTKQSDPTPAAVGATGSIGVGSEGGSAAVKAHPFLADVEWAMIREMALPPQAVGLGGTGAITYRSRLPKMNNQI